MLPTGAFVEVTALPAIVDSTPGLVPGSNFGAVDWVYIGATQEREHAGNREQSMAHDFFSSSLPCYVSAEPELNYRPIVE